VEIDLGCGCTEGPSALLVALAALLLLRSTTRPVCVGSARCLRCLDVHPN